MTKIINGITEPVEPNPEFEIMEYVKKKPLNRNVLREMLAVLKEKYSEAGELSPYNATLPEEAFEVTNWGIEPGQYYIVGVIPKMAGEEITWVLRQVEPEIIEDPGNNTYV